MANKRAAWLLLPVLGALVVAPALGRSPSIALQSSWSGPSYSEPVQTLAAAAVTLVPGVPKLVFSKRTGYAAGYGMVNNSGGRVYNLETRRGEFSAANPPGVDLIKAAGWWCENQDGMSSNSGAADVWMLSDTGGIVYPREAGR